MWSCTSIIQKLISRFTGLAESISFNVSSAIPPSPIPPSASMDSYTTGQSTRRSKRKSSRKPNSVCDTKPTTTTSAAVSDQAAIGRGSGRPGRKRVKTSCAAVAESAKVSEQNADIAMLPPTDK